MRTGAVEALDLVYHGLDARLVEGLFGLEAARRLHLRSGNEAVLLQRIEVVDALAGRTVQPFIGWMLVGPGRAAAMSPHDLKDIVHAYEIMRIDDGALAVDQGHRQLCRVDLAAEIARLATGVKACRIDIDVLGKRHLGTRQPLAIGSRREVGAVVTVIIEHAC